MTEGEWRPSAPLEQLRRRGEMLRTIRHYFDLAGVLEVDTPHCSAYGNPDPHIQSLAAHWQPDTSAGEEVRWLHTSPEFPMKRLLAAGSGPIYQICKVFRNGESGRLHNPEFTLLEWYRPGYTHFQLMEEVAELINQLSAVPRGIEHLSYAALFERDLGVDPLCASAERLQRLAIEKGIEGAEGLQLGGASEWLDLLFSYRIQPSLGNGSLCFVHGYPASQASLAALDPHHPERAERFELFCNGIELANGFHELRDPQELERRFTADLQRGRNAALPQPPIDRLLLQAMESGLPDCSGVALGLERLQMVLGGLTHIDQVIAFPHRRA